MAAAKLASVLLTASIPTSTAFVPSSISSVGSSAHIGVYAAKRRKNKSGDTVDNTDENQWYDNVNEDASPEDVFWNEMERRRLLNTSGMAFEGGDIVGMVGGQQQGEDGGDSPSSSLSSTIASQAAFEDDYMGPGSNNAMSLKNPGVSIAEERDANSILASYSAYAVSDNYLYDDDDDELPPGLLRNDPSLWEGEDPTLEEENAELNRQLDELEAELMGDGVDGSVVGGSSPFFNPSLSDEPWDRYYDQSTKDSSEMETDDEDGEGTSAFQKELERKMKMVNQSAKEFTLDYDLDHPEEAKAEAEKEEEEYILSLSTISIISPRLENAAVNPKAETFFQRKPDALQGYDTMWASALDTPCIKIVTGTYSNYGIQFADNFDDWDEGSGTDDANSDAYRSIEDIASYKARRVYEVTGLPCIASRTSFEVEPIRPEDLDKTSFDASGGGPGGKKGKQPQKSPRVVTGYRFNNIGEHVDHIVQSLLPFSEPTRVTRYRSCICFYDGDMEIFEYGELDCDIYFSGSMRTFIPMSSALNSLLKSLELALDLQYQKWLHSKINDATSGGTYSEASIKLRDRVLKEAKVLPNDIIDVSSFMDALVDVDLMDQCGKELSERLTNVKPTKILTIATTGLVVAIPMAKYLQVPLVYARKQRSVVMADVFDVGYNSNTIGQDQQLLVSREHIDEDDRVLIIDDFLSSGSSQEALLRIISEAGATAVGVGVLLEKEYEAGRKSLSGYQIPVESVVRIASVKDGVIQLVEEDGYEHM